MNFTRFIRLLVLTTFALLVYCRTQGNHIHSRKDTVLLEYFKKIGSDSAYLYLTDKYQLTEQSCATVVRKTGVNRNGFQDGPYGDYTTEGKLIGIGSYSEGLRDGLFRSYHENGKLKSVGEFIKDKPAGKWKGFDNAGGLVRMITYEHSQPLISHVVANGKKQITNGNGKFKGEFYSLVLNQTLYTSGKVLNGRMEGKWRIWEKTVNGEERQISIEYFDNGKFVLGSLSSSANRFQREYHTKSIISFLESEYYFLIEKGNVISCTDLKNKKPQLVYFNKTQLESLVQKRVQQKYVMNLNDKTEQLYEVTIDRNGVVNSVESIGPEPIYPMDEQLKQIVLKSKWNPGENIHGTLETNLILVIEFTPTKLSNQQSLNNVPFVVNFRVE